MMKSKVKGESSERIAEEVLRKLGYEILEKNKKVTLNEAEVFEVDFIVEGSSGVKYSVEVKSGRASVSDLRQIYANSRILDLHPLIVCKGLADEAASAVAGELDVKVIRFSEHYLLLDPEELEMVVRSAVRSVLSEYGFHPLPRWDEIERDDWRIVEEVAGGANISEVAETLDLKLESLGKRLGEMRKRGILPRRPQDFRALKSYCQQIINRYDIFSRLERIEKKLEKAG